VVEQTSDTHGQTSEGINDQNTIKENTDIEDDPFLGHYVGVEDLYGTPLLPLNQYTLVDKMDEKREAIRKAFLHAWGGYKRYAWGSDELKPISKKKENGWGGVGATLLDSLDTIIVMELDDILKEARDFVKDVKFEIDYDASTFESIIRFVGGLLSAYELTGDILYLKKIKRIC